MQPQRDAIAEALVFALPDEAVIGAAHEAAGSRSKRGHDGRRFPADPQEQATHSECDGRSEHLTDQDAATGLIMFDGERRPVGQETDGEPRPVGDANEAQFVLSRRGEDSLSPA